MEDVGAGFYQMNDWAGIDSELLIVWCLLGRKDGCPYGLQCLTSILLSHFRLNDMINGQYGQYVF